MNPPPPFARWPLAVARHRLAQFAAGAAVLWLLVPAPPTSRDIKLNGAALEALASSEAARRRQPSLSPEELAALKQRVLEDEVLYREALRLGLDRADPVLRRHLVQKMLLLAEDMAGVGGEPSETDLRRCYDAEPGGWVLPEQVHLVHVFAGKPETLAAMDRELSSWTAPTPPPLGEPLPFPREVRASRSDLSDQFGPSFPRDVQAVPAGTWSAPIASKYGWHRVRVLERTEARPATFEEVRPQLRLECAIQLRQHATRAFVEQARRRYRIQLDGADTDLTPTGRLAMRGTASAED